MRVGGWEKGGGRVGGDRKEEGGNENINFFIDLKIEKKKRESLSEKLEKWNEALSQKTTASIAKLKTIDWKKLKNHKYLKYFLLGVGFGSAFLLFSHLTDDSTIIYNVSNNPNSFLNKITFSY